LVIDKNLFILLNLPFTLPALFPKFVSGRRVYPTPDGNLPSITSVLGSLPRFKTGIDNWRQRIGKQAADFESKRCLNRGTQYHKICELHLSNKIIPDNFDALPMKLFNNTKEQLGKINLIHGLEKSLWSKELGVAGTADCIGNFSNTLSIIDFKTSTRLKQKSWITKYFLQECAYSLMYKERTGIDITNLVTILAIEDGSTQVFIENRDDWIDELHDCLNEAGTLMPRCTTRTVI
jgi:genome maintenance exonuclease 1